MLKLERIIIKNFKSIRELEFDFKSYGSGQKSNTTFILGINESGKSNFLKAIAALNNGIEGAYPEVCFKGSQDDGEDVLIEGSYKVVNQEKIKELISGLNNIPDELKAEIELINVTREWTLNQTSENKQSFDFQIKKIPAIKYIFNQQNQIKPFVKSKEEGFELLTTSKLKEILRQHLNPIFPPLFPSVIFWTPDSAHLITSQISLSGFINNPNTSIPFQNILHIYGLTSIDQMKTVLQSAINSQEKMAELSETLSDSITSHINKIWKSHPVNFKFYVNGDSLTIVVEDKLKKFRYFNMKQRSEGFKQFVSLMLSLSAKNKGTVLENQTILIDEPEMHLHPGGIIDMRDELLKIGKKNSVLVSTHSNFMIDTSTIERHWIMEKNEESSLTQIDETKSLHDEEVVSRAFGLEIMKELVPKNVIVVEGKCDQIIIEIGLKHFSSGISYGVKNAGGCSKVYSICSILAAEKFSPFVFMDGDDDGIREKQNILTNLKDYYSKSTVKLISDLGFTSVPKPTIEDLYPRDFVKSWMKSNFEIDIDAHPSKSIMESIKIQMGVAYKNKQILLKTNLSEAFKEKYNDKAKLETDAPELVKVLKNFIELLEKEN